MDSSINTLAEAFRIISNHDASFGGHEAAFAISEKFKQVNPKLSEGWATVGEACQAISVATKELLSVVSKDVNDYIRAVQMGELDLMNAIKVATEESQEILKFIETTM